MRLRGTEAGARPRHELLTPALLLLGPLFLLLRHHDYPLIRTEVGIVAAAAVVVGVLVGLWIHRARLALRLAALVVLLTLVWDLYGSGGSLQWAIISVGISMLVVLVLKTHITTIAFVVSIPLLASTLLPPVDPVETTQETWPITSRNRDLPPVFHFVLDEHVGLAGLASDEALAHDLASWYAQRGFRVLPNAYSPYYDTYNALPNFVNFTTESYDSRHLQLAEGEPPVVRDNRYFDEMRARGYRIRVYQSDYLDFCDGETARSLASCMTYPANSLAYAVMMPLPTKARASLLVHYLLGNRSWFFDRAVSLYEHHVHPAIAEGGAPAVLRAGRGSHIAPQMSVVLDRITQDLAQGARGTLFFAHLLTPHYPYQYDASCRVRERIRDRLDRASPTAPDGLDNTPTSRARRLALYTGQVRCAMRQLGAFFRKLDSLGIYAPAVVILHGDHGSRIVLRRPEGRENVGRLTHQDLLDGYSTLFAVKAPGIPVATDTTTAAVGELLESLVSADFRSAPSIPRTRAPTVYVVDRPNGPLIPVSWPH